MHWVIEYKNGKSISENEKNFNFANQENIRAIYFLDGTNMYGVLDNGFFFINSAEFDFKINKQPQKYIQFKSASLTFDGINAINSWNLGFEIYSIDGFEKYIMSINKDREIYFNAQRTNFKTNSTNEKKIRLQ